MEKSWSVPYCRLWRNRGLSPIVVYYLLHRLQLGLFESKLIIRHTDI